jgi:hypothetical protein
MTTRCDIKRQVWPPRDHFEKLLEEACPHHAYPVKHKRNDCSMIKNFMTSGSLAQGKDPEGDSGGKGMTPFLREEVVMTVYDGRPPPRRHRLSNLSLRTLSRYS